MQLPEFLHFINALACFQLSNLLALADVATEIAISLRLRLSDALCEPANHTVTFCLIPRDASPGARAGLVCDVCDWQEVVYLDVGVAARERNGQAGGSAVQPRIIAAAKYLTQHAPTACPWEASLLRQAFAEQYRVLQIHPIIHREACFALFSRPGTQTCIWDSSLLRPALLGVDVMLRALQVLLQRARHALLISICVCAQHVVQLWRVPRGGIIWACIFPDK